MSLFWEKKTDRRLSKGEEKEKMGMKMEELNDNAETEEMY